MAKKLFNELESVLVKKKTALSLLQHEPVKKPNEDSGHDSLPKNGSPEIEAVSDGGFLPNVERDVWANCVNSEAKNFGFE